MNRYVFAVCESCIFMRYGESHFLHHMLVVRWGRTYRGVMAVDLLPTVGAVAPAILLIALADLRLSFRSVAVIGWQIAAGYVLLGFIPRRMDDPRLAWAFFAALGFLFFEAQGAVAGSVLLKRSPRGGPRRARQDGWFLVSWLALEVLGYFVLSPFPATRRVIGIVIAGTFLAGYLAARTCRAPRRLALVHGCATGGALLGLFLYGVDLCDAIALKRVARDAVLWTRSHTPDSAVWYSASWAVNVYFEWEGLQYLEAGRSQVHAGDRIIQVEGGPLVSLPGNLTELEATIGAGDFIPWSVSRFSGSPLVARRPEGPRDVAKIYRALADFVPPPVRR